MQAELEGWRAQHTGPLLPEEAVARYAGIMRSPAMASMEAHNVLCSSELRELREENERLLDFGKALAFGAVVTHAAFDARVLRESKSEDACFHFQSSVSTGFGVPGRPHTTESTGPGMSCTTMSSGTNGSNKVEPILRSLRYVEEATEHFTRAVCSTGALR